MDDPFGFNPNPLFAESGKLSWKKQKKEASPAYSVPCSEPSDDTTWFWAWSHSLRSVLKNDII